jgi:hypothetical protein
MKLSAKISNLRRELFNEYHFDERFQQQFTEIYEMASELEKSANKIVDMTEINRYIGEQYGSGVETKMEGGKLACKFFVDGNEVIFYPWAEMTLDSFKKYVKSVLDIRNGISDES